MTVYRCVAHRSQGSRNRARPNCARVAENLCMVCFTLHVMGIPKASAVGAGEYDVRITRLVFKRSQVMRHSETYSGFLYLCRKTGGLKQHATVESSLPVRDTSQAGVVTDHAQSVHKLLGTCVWSTHLPKKVNFPEPVLV